MRRLAALALTALALASPAQAFITGRVGATAVLTKAVQEPQAEIKELKAEVKALRTHH